MLSPFIYLLIADGQRQALLTCCAPCAVTGASQQHSCGSSLHPKIPKSVLKHPPANSRQAARESKRGTNAWEVSKDSPCCSSSSCRFSRKAKYLRNIDDSQRHSVRQLSCQAHRDCGKNIPFRCDGGRLPRFNRNLQLQIAQRTRNGEALEQDLARHVHRSTHGRKLDELQRCRRERARGGSSVLEEKHARVAQQKAVERGRRFDADTGEERGATFLCVRPSAINTMQQHQHTPQLASAVAATPLLAQHGSSPSSWMKRGGERVAPLCRSHTQSPSCRQQSAEAGSEERSASTSDSFHVVE